uniref:Uncharacterized protein n=1 Tax=Timema poppense TaxID=170557 RepID=A0A7R9GZS7_TIMPO|nr:unnamed protein product [Timema poppensis]
MLYLLALASALLLIGSNAFPLYEKTSMMRVSMRLWNQWKYSLDLSCYELGTSVVQSTLGHRGPGQFLGRYLKKLQPPHTEGWDDPDQGRYPGR